MALTGILAKYFWRKNSQGRSEYNIYSLAERENGMSQIKKPLLIAAYIQ